MNKEKLASLQKYVSELKARLSSAPNKKNEARIDEWKAWLEKEIKTTDAAIAVGKEKL